MIRLLVRTAIVLAGNAVGLIAASLLFDDFEIDVTGFVVSLIIFTVVVALMTPFLATVAPIHVLIPLIDSPSVKTSVKNRPA